MLPRPKFLIKKPKNWLPPINKVIFSIIVVIFFAAQLVICKFGTKGKNDLFDAIIDVLIKFMSKTAQKVKQTTETCTEVQSATLVRNVIRSSISSIAYLRYLFPENCFNDAQIAGIKIKSLVPGSSPEIESLMHWVEMGVFDALEKHYLRAMIFSIFARCNDPSSLIESYTFKFTYPSDDSVNLDILADSGNTKQCLSSMTKDQLQQAWCTMIRTLITLSHTLPPLPSERYLAVRLYYYDETTPNDYNPPGFSESTEMPNFEFVAESERIEVGGGVSTKYHMLSMRIDTAVSNLNSSVDNTACSADLSDQMQKSIVSIVDSDSVSRRVIGDGLGLPRNSKQVEDIMSELLNLGFIEEKDGILSLIKSEKNMRIYYDCVKKMDQAE